MNDLQPHIQVFTLNKYPDFTRYSYHPWKALLMGRTGLVLAQLFT
jgi:hypothetical protein